MNLFEKELPIGFADGGLTKSSCENFILEGKPWAASLNSNGRESPKEWQ